MEPGEIIAEAICRHEAERRDDDSVKPVTAAKLIHQLGYKRSRFMQRDLCLYLLSQPHNHPHRVGCRAYLRRLGPSPAFREEILDFIDTLLADRDLGFTRFHEIADLLGFGEQRLRESIRKFDTRQRDRKQQRPARHFK